MSLLDAEKLFYERFYALHRNRDLLQVFEHFGIGVFRRSSVLEGFEAFLDAHQISGKCCVEIGTLTGLTAVVLSRRFEKVVTVDVVDVPVKRTITALLGIKNIEFIDVADNAAKAEAINALPSFDAAYVDGDHARDTSDDFHLVKRCGRVLFHEYWPAQPDVWGLVNALRSQGSVVTQGKLALWMA